MERNDGKSASVQGMSCASEIKQRTVREEIARVIEEHNQQIAALMALRDATPPFVLDMPQSTLARLVYPSNPF